MALSESFSGTDNQLKFNLSITKKKLGEIHGDSEINKLLTMDTDNEEIHRRKVLALTGWKCKQIPAIEGQQVASFYLECISCFFRVHSA